MSANDDVLLKEFLIESYDGLNSLKSFINDLEKDPSSSDIINNLFRTVHTLKGSASFLGFTRLKNLSHSVEGLLDHLRQFKIAFGQDTYDILLESFDCFHLILKSIEATKSEVGVEVDTLIVKLELFLELPSGNPATESSKAPVIELAAIPVYQEMPDKQEKKDEVVETPRVPEGEAKKTISVADSVVKVNVKLLDKIMNMIGELVVNRNQILQYAGKNDDFDLQKLTHQLDLITSELQNEFMSTRMQPVGQVLNKFERVVKDLSKLQGKKVQLQITGQETELDKTLIEAIKDPLTHLIRNAVDHGIEQPQERINAKKNEVATLKLMALHENGKVSIRIQDDGRGIDHERIKSKAVEKGIITKEASEKMGIKDIVNLIFAPGFSTAEKVTDISGRGVGMDVVKTNIEKIGGEIDIQTVKGLGTTITLKIPLTLAIIPSLTVYSNQKAYCIPQLNIVEFVLLDVSQNSSQLQHMHGVNFLRLREKLIPIYSLTALLEQPDMKGLSELENNDLLNIVVVNGDGQEYGLVVDSIFDIEEIVVKPLSRNLKNLEYYSGATIMGSGEISLILDTSSIIRKINPNRLKNEIKIEEHSLASHFRNDGTRDFLIFTLRDNKKYGVSLSFIERIEEIEKHHLNFSGTNIFTKYRDQVMPLVDVQRGIDSSAPLVLDGSMVQVLVINVQGHLVGLIVNKVHDTLSIMDDIDEFANNHPSLSGTVYVKDEAVLILNLTHILNSINIDINSREGKDKKILFHVDDSKMHRSIFKDIIETEFSDIFEIISFENPVEFFNYLKNNESLVKELTLLMTDIDMPKMNGWELVKELNKNYSHLKILPMTLTSRDELEDKEKSKEINIRCHLKKFDKVDIVNAVKSFLGWEIINPQDEGEVSDSSSLLSNQYCGFKIGQEVFAISIMNVQEVVRAQFVSTVPKSPKEVKGLINLRGQIVTSICLADVFKCEHTPKEEHMNIIVKNHEGFTSLMVDEILDVMNFEESEKSMVPDNVDEGLKKYFESVYKKPNELITVIDVNKILEDVL